MDSALREAVEELLAERTGAGVRIVADRPAAGGCIHDARLLELSDGGRVFLKADDSAPDDLFEREAEGLAALAAADAIRVPRDPQPGHTGHTAFLLMEAIPAGRPGRTFWEDFGRRFARLHRTTEHERYGFPHDNYLGGTPQPNDWTEDWAEFFRTHRLGHQLDLARQRGRSTAELDRLGDRFLDRLDHYLDVPDEPPCLLHGDLWSGNQMADEAGDPVLIDPAAYYGQREADLAMTALFGRFDDRFYRAYEDEWPLPPGTAQRQEIYQLYHLLNHLNLFGSSYLDGCLRILRKYA